MLTTGIKSRPVYTTIHADPGGRFHLLVGEGSGGEALLRLLGELTAESGVRVIYAGESFTGRNLNESIRAAGRPDTHILPTQAEAPAELYLTLTGCLMGTRLYVAGS